MITGSIKSQIDQIWNAFWSGGISNPLEVRFEYLSYIFEHLPTATTVEALEALLPWNVKPILAERRKQSEAALRSAAAT